ncbi:MAG: putative toxin-antitoxin system toxin component, PIN family [Elusimicrobia bacterium]|nr:putative toxin-antitoxin system toxin component, PIN family [Elusimicrobiota bacterium]
MDSLPAAILDLALQEKIKVVVSHPILAEMARVLHRPRFGFEPRKIGSFLALFKSRSKLVFPEKTLTICQEDLSDNRFLECAETAKVEFLITGNKSHFPSCYRNTAVVTPREFWDTYLLRIAL